jgi:hypothetical protein
MGLKRKQMQLRQKAYFEQKLRDRLSFLTGKGIEPPKADKDPLVRKLQANIRAVNHRLRLIVANEKRTEEMAKIKAERAAAPLKEQEGGKAEKPKKGHEEVKGKKIKAEKKAAPQKTPESGESHPPAGSPGEGKATMKKKKEATAEEPAGQVKVDQ